MATSGESVSIGETSGKQAPPGTQVLSSVQHFGGLQPSDSSRPKAGTFNTYRKMRSNPTIALARLASTAPIRTADWSVDADEGVPAARKKFITEQLAKIWPNLINDLCLALDYGFSPFEIVWATGGGGTKYVVDKVKPLLVDITNPEVAADSGKFTGIENDKIVLPLNKCLWYAYDQEAGNLYGRSRHENIRETAYRDWCDLAAKCSMYVKRVAGAVPLIEYPDGESTDKSGATRSNWDIARQILNELSNCNGIAMPNVLAPYVEDFARAGGGADKLRAWNIDFLEDKVSHGSEFLELMRHKESLMMRGWLCPERVATEAQTAGSRADSESHGDLMAGMADIVVGDMVQTINTQLVDPLLRLNFGAEAVGTVRVMRSKVANDVQLFIRELTKLLLGNVANTALMLDILDVHQLADRSGLPLLKTVFDQKKFAEKAAQQVAPLEEPPTEPNDGKKPTATDDLEQLQAALLADVQRAYADAESFALGKRVSFQTSTINPQRAKDRPQ
jgi:hypothetical protein